MALTREDWVRAALLAVAQGGTAAAAVEPLAARLGATKGSFYWHFTNRGELISEALAFWERESTDRIIEELKGVEDPFERLRLVLRAAMEDEADEDGAIDAALLATAGDPLVGDTIRRVQRKRLGFLERCFLDMGLPPAESRQRARIGYAVYLGWFRLRQAAGERGLGARERAAYQRTALALLTGSG